MCIVILYWVKVEHHIFEFSWVYNLWVDYLILEYSWVFIGFQVWEEVSIFPFFIQVSSLCYVLEFPLHVRTFHVLSQLACIFSRCRHMHTGSSTRASLIHLRVRVIYGEHPYFWRISITFQLSQEVVGLVPTSIFIS